MQACPLPDDKIVVYGGEDSHRRPLADAYVLDLQVRIESTGSLDCHTRHWWVGGRMHAVDKGSLGLCMFVSTPAGLMSEHGCLPQSHTRNLCVLHSCVCVCGHAGVHLEQAAGDQQAAASRTQRARSHTGQQLAAGVWR